MRLGYLGLGSNVGDRRANLQAAVEELWTHGVAVLASSSVYETEPVGEVPDQRAFLNACVRIETELEPEALLDVCKAVERALGRAPGGVRHGPRPIDVDVLLLGDVEHESERLHAAARRGDLAAVRARAAARARPRPRGPGLRASPPRRARRDRGPGGPARRPAARRATVAAMLLVVDVGNTQTHIGTFEGARAASSTGASPPCASRRPTSWAPRCARCSGCASVGFGDSTRRSCPRPSPSCAPEWAAMAEPLPRPRDAGGRPGPADRHADPLRQPARDRARPARQRRRGARALRRAVRRRRLRDRPSHIDIVSADGEYIGGMIVARDRDLDRGADRARREAPAGRARRAARADRQVDGRRDPLRRGLRLRRDGRRDRDAPARRARRGHSTIATGGLAAVRRPALPSWSTRSTSC